MRLKKRLELEDKRIGREIEHFFEFTGRDLWKKQIEKLDQVRRSSKHIYYKHWLSQRNPFLLPLEEFFELTQKGKSIWRHASPSLKALAKRIFVLNILIGEFNKTAQNKLIGIFRSQEGINSFLFEVEIATHFLVKESEVLFVDLEDLPALGTYDLLVKANDIEVEIECKRKSVDAGRNITRQGFYLLSDELCWRLRRIPGSYAVSILCQKALGKNQKYFQKVASEVLEAITQNRGSLVIDNKLIIQIIHLPSGLRICSDKEAAKVIVPYWSPKAHLCVLSNERQTIIIRTESTENDTLLNSIFEELKKGAKQLSKKRLALLTCFIEDVREQAWYALRQQSGLANMTKAFFYDRGTDHINIVVYSSDLPAEQAWVRDFSHNLFFRNPSPRFHVPNGFFGF